MYLVHSRRQKDPEPALWRDTLAQWIPISWSANIGTRIQFRRDCIPALGKRGLLFCGEFLKICRHFLSLEFEPLLKVRFSNPHIPP